MSDYLVEPLPIRSFTKLVTETKIHFEPEQLSLGEVLLSGKNFPRTPKLLHMDHGACMATSVRQLLTDPLWNSRRLATLPVHPALVMALAACIDRERVCWHIGYEMAMSPYVLRHADGRRFIFTLLRGKEHFAGAFKDVSTHDFLPRCMHIRAYSTEDGKGLKAFYKKGKNGLYGHYVYSQT